MNMWKSGIMGVVIGDALGCPVQFKSREEVARNPVTGMRGFGTFNLPAGSWTDDSSLTLALLDSIRRTGAIDCKDIMDNFVQWLDDGAFTPYGYAYDIGRFGNCNDRIAFGYEKDGQFVELGMIGSAGDGFYVIPNPKHADFWAKCGLTLLEKRCHERGWKVSFLPNEGFKIIVYYGENV